MQKMRFEFNTNEVNNIEILAELFPSCVTENEGNKKVIDFDKLKLLVGNVVSDEGTERYEFTWVGKRKAIIEANRMTRNTLRPDVGDSLNWETTKNLYIEGDNLEVLKILQESYLGQVKFIYIDPPYNTGSDFIYKDNFRMSQAEYDELTASVDDENNRMFRNTDSNGRFHSDWCSMIYPRLVLARNLLSDEGVIFISIDDNELDNLKKICDEVFGESNFVANMIWQSTAGSNTGTEIVTVTENILIYTKKRDAFAFNGMLASDKSYSLSDEYESIRGKYALDKLDRRRVGSHYSEALNFPIEMPDGSLRYPGGGTEPSTEGWNYLWSKTKVKWGIDNGFIEFKQNNGQWNVYNKRYALIDNEGNPVERTIPFRNLITSDQCNTAQGTAELRNLFGFRPFDFPKPSTLIKNLMLTAIRTDKEAIVMDFFSGSASTAQAVMQLNADDGGNRKFIMVQVPEELEEESEGWNNGYRNICEIGKDRIRKAGSEISKINSNVDIGFRVFRVDDSNMKDVYFSVDEYSQDLLNMLESNIKEDRSELDLLFGCILGWGLPLSMGYSSEIIDGVTVHDYNDGDLIACFSDNIQENVIRKIADKKPLRAVFRDSSFMNSPSKINVSEIFKLISPDTTIKVI